MYATAQIQCERHIFICFACGHCTSRNLHCTNFNSPTHNRFHCDFAYPKRLIYVSCKFIVGFYKFIFRLHASPD